MLSELILGAGTRGVDPELQQYLREVQDHAIHVQDEVAGFRELLQNVLSVNLSVVSLQQNDEIKALTESSISQNDEIKRLSGWAALLFAPTLIRTIYGMNFTHMPELDWRLGYPFSVLLVFVVSAVMYAGFKRRGWLS